MSHQDFAEAFLGALAHGDFDTIGTMLAEDFVLHEAAGLPYGGEYFGIQGWRDVSKAITAEFAGFRLDRKEYFGETADSLVLRLFIRGRSRKTGTPFETSVLELWRFRDGKLREITPYYWDTHLLATISA